MRSLRAFAITAPRRTLAAVALIGVVAAVFGVGTPDRLSVAESDYFSAGTQSFKALRLIETTVARRGLPEFTIAFPVRGPVGQHVLDVVQSVAQLSPQLEYSRNRRQVAVQGYFHPGLPPGSTAVALAKQFQRNPGVLVTGRALVAQEFKDQVQHDLKAAEIVAFPLFLLLTFLIFRSVVAAFLPSLVGGLTLVLTLFCLRLINAVHSLSIFSLNVVLALAVALSIDYSLLLVSRYREELAGGLDAAGAAGVAASTAGRTVAFSAATVAAAFASLLVFPINFVVSIAVGGMLAAAIAGLVSVAVLPAVFTLLGPRVNALAPRRLQRAAQRAALPAERGAWYRLARLVMRRPLAIAVAATVVLLALGAPFLGMRLTGFASASLPVSVATHRAEARLQAEFPHSGRDETALAVRGDVNAIRAIGPRIAKLPGADGVSAKSAGRGGLWVLKVGSRSPPFSRAAERLVREIRALPYRLGVTGVTANYLDTIASLREHLALAAVLLAATTLILIFIATGSVILPIKTLVTNMLTLAATLGVLVWVFQDGRFEGLLGYRGQGGLLLIQPIIIGTIAFGISIDYGVFLLTRIKEGWDSGLSNSEAVALGLERTGRIITAAALLFCAAVGAVITSRIVSVKEAGVGLIVAVVIDVTIVRAFLTPSVMVLLGRWNWWRPSLSRWRTGRPRPAGGSGYPTVIDQSRAVEESD